MPAIPRLSAAELSNLIALPNSKFDACRMPDYDPRNREQATADQEPPFRVMHPSVSRCSAIQFKSSPTILRNQSSVWHRICIFRMSKLPDGLPFHDTTSRATFMHQDLNDSCEETCLACAVACRESAEQLRGDHDKAQLAEICRDCADHCIICVADLRDNSPLLVHSSRMCAFACEICADECSKHQGEHIRRCEAACRASADECRAVRLMIGEMQIRRREA
jgi:hypothetical protein